MRIRGNFAMLFGGNFDANIPDALCSKIQFRALRGTHLLITALARYICIENLCSEN